MNVSSTVAGRSLRWAEELRERVRASVRWAAGLMSACAEVWLGWAS